MKVKIFSDLLSFWDSVLEEVSVDMKALATLKQNPYSDKCSLRIPVETKFKSI